MMKITTFLFSCSILFSLTDAFTVPPPPRAPQHSHRHGTTQLHAEGSAPDYDKRNVVLLRSELVGNGSAVLLHIDREEGDEEPFSYLPGHVLALEIEYNQTRDEDVTDMDNKISKDMNANNGWMRGPYTVSGATTKTINILLQIVGVKSKAFATAAPNTPLKLGGKFKVPIVEGISANTKRVVMISTGVGIGPCVGAIETLLPEQCPFSIDLVASFRTPQLVLYQDYLQILTECYGEDKFQYKPIVTSEVGRLASSDENMKLVTSDNNACSLTETHYHLIGNGQMVNEWKTGLKKAGVPDEKVTLEIYFNHKAEPSEEAIERISNTISAAALDAVAAKK